MLVSLYDAKTQLSALVEAAAGGTEIIITKNGRPRAKLIAVRDAARRRPGRAKGKIWLLADFDAPLPPELLDGFLGRTE
jgi:prevent-host-death family protein